MIFKDEQHETFYYKYIAKTGSCGDVYRKALFYTLGLTENTRNHINRIYNFEDECIEPDCLKQGWQTSQSLRVINLAYNLFNGFISLSYNVDYDDLIDPNEAYLVSDIFCDSLTVYFFEAIKIRFPEYYRPKKRNEGAIEC